MRLVRVQAEAFDTCADCAELAASSADIGAIVAFTGLCRSEGGSLAALEIEHYREMAITELTELAAAAEKRFSLHGLVIRHRFGRIEARAPIVLVATAASHRREAFDAAEFLMDFLKTDAPFWKKRIPMPGAEGGWVGAASLDDAARARWEQAEPRS
jgi:molybdopterin synthase catalytic subunit